MSDLKKQIKEANKGLDILQDAIDSVVSNLAAEDAQKLLKGLSAKLLESRTNIVKYGKEIEENSPKMDLIKYFDALIQCQGEVSFSRSLVNVISKG